MESGSVEVYSRIGSTSSRTWPTYRCPDVMFVSSIIAGNTITGYGMCVGDVGVCDIR